MHFSEAPGGPTLSWWGEDELVPTPPDYIFDPEQKLAKLHNAMQRTDAQNDDVREEIRREAEAYMDWLKTFVWDLPTPQQERARLSDQLQETLAFFEQLPFRDTTLMKYLQGHELTYGLIEELVPMLRDRFHFRKDPWSSTGDTIYGSIAAWAFESTTQDTPRRVRRK